MFPIFTLFLTVISLIAFSSQVSAALVNVTVDDSQTNGTSVIQYTPTGVWNDGLHCDGCTAHPDPENAFDGTWHDSTHLAGAGEDGLNFATLEFEGVAIYVYCIIAHTSTSPDGNTDMTFSIDGNTAGSFALAPTNQTTYDYNVLVYSSTGLPSSSHTFTLQNGRVGGAKSLVLLDYIVYNHDDGILPPPSTPIPPPSPPSSPAPSRQVSTPPLPSSVHTAVQSTAIPPPVVAPSSAPLSILPSSTSSIAFSSPSHITTPTSLIPGTSIAADAGATTFPSANVEGANTSLAPPSSSADSRNPSFAAAPSHSISSKSRTIIIASTVSGGAVVLIAIIGSVFWCRRRRSRYVYTPPPERDIAEVPGSSGWTGDAWKAEAAASTPSGQGHGETTALTSTLYSNDPARSVGRSSARGTIGRARGLTTSSAVTTTSARSGTSDYSQGSTREYAAPEPMSSYAAEPAARTRHPYAARTPEPFEGSEEAAFGLPTVPEMPTPAPSSSASHSHSHEWAPSPEPSFVQEDGPGPSRMARPLPLRPIAEGTAYVARNRGVFRTPSGSSEMPPSYEDISGELRDSMKSLNDVKL